MKTGIKSEGIYDWIVYSQKHSMLVLQQDDEQHISSSYLAWVIERVGAARKIQHAKITVYKPNIPNACPKFSKVAKKKKITHAF